MKDMLNEGISAAPENTGKRSKGELEIIPAPIIGLLLKNKKTRGYPCLANLAGKQRLERRERRNG